MNKVQLKLKGLNYIFSFISSIFALFSPFCFSPLSSLFLLGLFIAGKDDYAIDIFSFGICALEVRKADPQSCFPSCLHTSLSERLLFLTDYLLLQMAVLEIQANGDTPVSKEAIAHAGQSLEDPLMRVSHTNNWRYHGNMPNDVLHQFLSTLAN